MSDLSWPLRRAARLHAGAVAVVDGERSVTYGALASRVRGLGAALERLRIAPGGRVGFLGVNSLAHHECWLGVPAFGRVLVDLNYRLAEDELAFMADDAGLELLIAGAEQLDVAHALRERCPALREVVLDGEPYESLIAGGTAEPPGAAAHALATISYTGGTTGTPKGVMLSHANLLANALHNLVATGHRADTRFLNVCPMFHVAGVSNLFACTWVGATQVVLPRFDAAAVAAAIGRERITHTTLVPTMLGMLLDTPELAAADLSTLRHLQYAASPISPELQRRVLERLDCDVVQFYGMTEAAPTVTQLTAEEHRAGGEPLASMGRPVPGVEVEIRDPLGAPLPPGEVGELWVRGPNVMLGYWHREDATAEALAGGWYRSGDAARADADGYLYMVDRLKDMIITGAENVYSVEVEGVLAEHDAVLEAAVFGVPDERWGEAVHAVVTVRSPVEPDELIAHCRGRIAGFKVPRSVVVQAEPLPKSGAGKILKNRLREPYWEGVERRVG